MKKSPIDFADLKEFRLSVESLRRFFHLGKDKRTKSLIHIAYFHRDPVSDLFTISTQFVQLNAFCKQYLIMSSSVNVGVLFVAQSERVDLKDNYLTIGSMKSTKGTEPGYALESCGIISYKSFDGSVILVSTKIESDLLIKDE